ncbi:MULTISPECIES: RNase adapter RapZ [Terribacillus]|jgi:RNase adapter protein RapZ|uniref:RNase adaptor protein RapZ n=1 Tax=Terribacillus saccharophilus TaxID=361277 RepID=A0A268AFB3_9BACI|nr:MULTISPECIES: RNase adapter RapZ [Terribacillus]PAD22805.1 RNase adaptor protein RapZ [Terribacillus saccharophilus]PAE09098.1 RNase adaptor protein RapZ [Terribacillus saccharophilus]PAF18100.1 RNase adaptor protein RapZ [Terribacillus saccharophilus]PAF22740.1 RNase adaptor protein RapZ [Terribacillus saccharophilus]PAF35060.1 RNase adaptor protein RapZ [Terribacillus saccharophilus]
MEKQLNETKLVIITGMSGAGKTVAVQSFEDLGYYCVDNLPPALLPTFLDLMRDAANDIKKVALVMDLRGREFFDSLFEALDKLTQENWLEPQVLFLDSKDEVLVTRYKETRRTHPLAPEGLPLEGIQQERALLDQMRGRAQFIVDTSTLKPKQLREKIMKRFKDTNYEEFTVQMLSFGFKYGLPIDADLVFDVRFLPNPFYVENLRPQTGLDEPVSSYVFKWSDTHTFLQKLEDMLTFMLPQYKKEGKSQLIIAIGCTGGQHRSVAIAEYLAKRYSDNYATHVTHRDVERKSH